MTVGRSDMEGRTLLMSSGVDFHAVRYEKLDHFEVALGGGTVERAIPTATVTVDIYSATDISLDQRQMIEHRRPVGKPSGLTDYLEQVKDLIVPLFRKSG